MSEQQGAEEEWATRAQAQTSVNYSERVLEEKERRLRESIQRNYGRIKDVERELSELQLQLRMNVGPKKQGLEMLRRKIETQNERLAAARAHHTAAAAAAKQAAEALEQEERVKQQLCSELNLLVQQSAHSQLDKLEQLTQRLETLNTGLAVPGQDAAHPEESGNAVAAAALQRDAEALRGAILASAAAPNGADSGAASPAAAAPPAEPAAPQGQQQPQGAPAAPAAQQQQQQRQLPQPAPVNAAAAAAARSRHVALGKQPSRLPRQPSPQQQQQPAPAQRAGPFQGFD